MIDRRIGSVPCWIWSYCADEYAAAQLTAADELVILNKALGGGWEQNQSLPPIRRPQPAIEAAVRRLLSSTESAQ
jgi:hypothetical protein